MSEETKPIEEMTEFELRDLKAPWPKSLEELAGFIAKLVSRSHDYGTCVYAMSLASVAAFNYVSSELGCTGFQASMADMDFIRRTRSMEHGFRIVDYGNLLYPQYQDDEHFPTRLMLLEENAKDLAETASKLLAEKDGMVHPDVKAWWEKLASKSPVKSS